MTYRGGEAVAVDAQCVNARAPARFASSRNIVFGRFALTSMMVGILPHEVWRCQCGPRLLAVISDFGDQ
jgi:hypothetical protein